MPMRSRRCNAEQTSKRHWKLGEDEVRDEAEQKNCLIIAHYDPAKDRNGALQELLRFSVFMRRKAFFILLLFF